jgi:hypothetical protein
VGHKITPYQARVGVSEQLGKLLQCTPESIRNPSSFDPRSIAASVDFNNQFCRFWREIGTLNSLIPRPDTVVKGIGHHNREASSLPMHKPIPVNSLPPFEAKQGSSPEKLALEVGGFAVVHYIDEANVLSAQLELPALGDLAEAA